MFAPRNCKAVATQGSQTDGDILLKPQGNRELQVGSRPREGILSLSAKQTPRQAQLKHRSVPWVKILREACLELSDRARRHHQNQNAVCFCFLSLFTTSLVCTDVHCGSRSCCHLAGTQEGWEAWAGTHCCGVANQGRRDSSCLSGLPSCQERGHDPAQEATFQS